MPVRDHALAAYRREAKLTQQALADILGIDRWTVTRIESGKYLPSPTMCLAIEAQTGVSRVHLRPDLFAGFVEVAQ